MNALLQLEQDPFQLSLAWVSLGAPHAAGALSPPTEKPTAET